MIIAQISVPGRPDRKAELKDGRHVFGSDLGCDVVLLDKDVSPQHFAITIEGNHVVLDVLDDCLTFARSGACDTNPGKQTSIVWSAGSCLRIGELEFKLRGATFRASAEELAMNKAARDLARLRITRKVRTVLMVLVCCIPVGAIATRTPDDYQSSNDTGSSSALSVVETPTAAPPRTPPKLTAEMVANTLAGQGFKVHRPDYDGTAWRADVYLTEDQDSADLTAIKDQLPFTFLPHVFTDTALLDAAKLVLANLNVSGANPSIHLGILKVAGVAEDIVLRDRIKTTLTSDIPGLIAIEFDGPAIMELHKLTDEIVGVWSGDRPFVVLQDGRIIKPGQEIVVGITLIAVQPKSVRVRENGRDQDVRIKS